MATRTPPDAAPLVVMGSRKARPAFAAAGYRGHVSRALAAAAILVIAVTFLRVAALWGLERQSSAEWQLTALASTAEALPWLVLAGGLFYTALYASESTSLLAYRLLGLCMILLGLIAAGIAARVVTQYGTLPQDMDMETVRLLRVATVKAVGIGVLHLIVLVPIGVLGLRRPGVT